MFNKNRWILVLALAVLAYFVSYPEDAQAITTPIATFLSLTTAVSPWLYGVAAVGIIATAIVKTWGGRAGT
jgi:hypothetical protein